MRKKAKKVPGLGERIQKSRETVGMTQAELAERINLSTQYISDLERSVVGASLNTVINICKSLSVSSDYLLFDHDKDNVEPLDTVIKIKSLSDSNRLLAEKMVDYMLDSEKSTMADKQQQK